MPSQVVGVVVRKHPFSTICVPLMVLVVLVGLGVYGVLAGAASTANSNQSTAYSIVRDTSLSFTLYIEKVGAWGCARGGRCMGMYARREVHGDVCAEGGAWGCARGRRRDRAVPFMGMPCACMHPPRGGVTREWGRRIMATTRGSRARSETMRRSTTLLLLPAGLRPPHHPE